MLWIGKNVVRRGVGSVDWISSPSFINLICARGALKRGFGWLIIIILLMMRSWSALHHMGRAGASRELATTAD
jgi:hypothetical protein